MYLDQHFWEVKANPEEKISDLKAKVSEAATKGSAVETLRASRRWRDQGAG